MPKATVDRDADPAGAARLLGRWDLGRKRSLNQLIAFTGIDTRSLTTEFDNCGKLEWVPFDEGGEDDDVYEQLEAERLWRQAADPVAEAERRLAALGAGESGRGPLSSSSGSGKGQQRRKGGVGSGAAAGASVHALSDRLPIAEEGGGQILAGMCMLAFVVLIAACLTATPLTRRQNRGLLQELGLPGKSVTKRV